MMANLLCPLDPFDIRLWENEMNLSRVEAIENHVQARTCYSPSSEGSRASWRYRWNHATFARL